MNMGAAMAPAAADTISRFFRIPGEGQTISISFDQGFGPSRPGALPAAELSEQGFDLGDNFMDCGLMIYDFRKRILHAGGSGCACSAVGHLPWARLPPVSRKVLQPGHLLSPPAPYTSPTTYQQAENIPTIAHAVGIEA